MSTLYNRIGLVNTIANVATLFVGTKIDLRENKEAIGQLASQGLSPVKREQGIKLANKIRAVKYMECSALTQRGLKQVCCGILSLKK